VRAGAGAARFPIELCEHFGLLLRSIELQLQPLLLYGPPLNQALLLLVELLLPSLRLALTVFPLLALGIAAEGDDAQERHCMHVCIVVSMCSGVYV